MAGSRDDRGDTLAYGRLTVTVEPSDGTVQLRWDGSLFAVVAVADLAERTVDGGRWDGYFADDLDADGFDFLLATFVNHGEWIRVHHGRFDDVDEPD